MYPARPPVDKKEVHFVDLYCILRSIYQHKLKAMHEHYFFFDNSRFRTVEITIDTESAALYLPRAI